LNLIDAIRTPSCCTTA